eukprot:5831748-Prorocentrum_lima.AAC.1
MTSSLVGSEMCIRDRRSPIHRFNRVWGDPRTEERLRSSGEAPCLGPVSYTHLTLPTICSV